MKDRKLAVRYARALLSVLREPAQAEATDRFLSTLAEAMDKLPEFRALMLDPAFPHADRVKALTALARQAGQPKTVINFLSIVVENNRAASFPSIAAVFHEEREAAAGIVPAEITTAAPLSEDLKERASRAMATKTGRQVRLTCRVDPSLIGGAVTRIGSTVYDGSLRTQLSTLRTKMVQE